MEPVPEAERMEEFRSSPLPSLRLQSSPALTISTTLTASPTTTSAGARNRLEVDDVLRKPTMLRRSTEPSSPVSPGLAYAYRPRTTSPLSGHMRSRSTASVGSGSSMGGGYSYYPPPMGRTQSMPGVNGAGHFQFLLDPRLSSPNLHRPPAINTGVRTPRKTVIEDVFPSSPTRMSVIHDGDRRSLERSSSPSLGRPASPAGLPLARTRRPQSPFHRVPNTSAPSAIPPCPTTPVTEASGAGGNLANTPSSVTSSLSGSSSYGSALSMLSSSSVPSTPTSTRSRSPSISSLETIPDSPDAEEEALEAERIAQLKAAAEAADGEAKGRNNLDGSARGRTLVFGPRDKRKRWSVCGAERRGDLDLETIWED